MDLKEKYRHLNDKVEKLIKDGENDVKKAFKNTLEELRTEIRKMYDKYPLEKGKLTLQEVSKYQRGLKLDKNVEDSCKKLYQKNEGVIKKTLMTVFYKTAEGTLDPIEEKRKKEFKNARKSFDVEKTVNSKMKGLHWAERLNHHRNDVIYAVQKTLKEGLAEGSTYRELSDRLKKELQGNVVQPMRIIRTESGRVYASAQLETLDRISSQVKLKKTWHTAKDERVRSYLKGDKTDHLSMEGQTVLYEEDFVFPDGVRTKAPRLSGVAGHDILCRCFMSIDFADRQIDSIFPSTEINEVSDFPLHTEEEVVEMSRSAHKIIGKYLKVKSKWSGNTVLFPEGSENVGRKEWNCDIQMNRHTDMYVLIHEHIHARSISHYDMKMYIKYQRMEEASVELLTKIIAKKENITIYEGGYDEMVEKLLNFNKILNLHSKEEDFAIELLEIPLPQRVQYLSTLFEEKMRGLTISEAKEAYEILKYFGGGYE